jgi:hypothetical protein
MAGGYNASVRHYNGTAIRAVLGGSSVSHGKKQKEDEKSLASQSAPLVAAKQSIIIEQMGENLVAKSFQAAVTSSDFLSLQAIANNYGTNKEGRSVAALFIPLSSTCLFTYSGCFSSSFSFRPALFHHF